MEFSSLNEQQVTMQLQISPGLPPSRFYAIIVPSRFSFFQGHSRYSIHSLLELDRARPNCAHLDKHICLKNFCGSHISFTFDSSWLGSSLFISVARYNCNSCAVFTVRLATPRRVCVCPPIYPFSILHFSRTHARQCGLLTPTAI